MTLFDLARLREELERANREIEQPDFWNNLEYAQKVMKEKKTMEVASMVRGMIDAKIAEVTGKGA